ncbi:bifunctional endoribonuclease/protein kinase ire1 [Paecilomyces lecythidis]|uniref:Bifunctional endoribonuclease/protein kinase ire1 n=1 Tax=Paecilomyces lecythidis TaxID=3004212 RepID=A0ABR3XE23_9EURO
MVFLRLTVKILPREQIQSTSSSLFRSFLPERKDDSDKNGNGGANGKVASFLLVLERPEEVTLGGLAGMIQAKWRKLRPDAEPLEIKKLVDDAHDSEDLDADMTVADVFVDNGKARTDGLDQRGTVRVIQRPAPYAPPRFSSVVQDWDAAAQYYERTKQVEAKNKPKVPKFETIEEESTAMSSRFSHDLYDSNGSRRQSDVPVRSVERDEPALSPPRWGRAPSELAPPSREPERDEEVAATPQSRRMESKELGESPTPIRQLAPEMVPDRFTRPGPPDVGTRRQRSDPRSQPVHLTETKSLVGKQEPASNPVAAAHERAQDDVDITDVEPEPEPPGEIRQASYPAVVIESPTLRSSVEKKARAAATRKRKKSGEELPPQKEPRLELTSSPSAARSKSKEPTTDEEHVEPPETFSPVRRREKAPSFSGPQRRSSLSDHPAKSGLGLGITKSPPRKQSVSNADERHLDHVSTTPLFPSSVSRRLSFGTPSKVQTPGLEHIKRSALRKDSPLERSQERRSVSFAEEADIVTTPAAPAPRSAPKSTSQPRSKATKPTTGSTPPSFSRNIIYPPNVPQERLQKYLEEAEKSTEKTKKTEKEQATKADYERKIKAAEERGDQEYIDLLRDAFSIWVDILKLKQSNQNGQHRRNLQKRLQRRELKIRNKELLLEKERSMDLSEAKSRSEAKAGSADRPSSRAPPKSRSVTKSKSPMTKDTNAVDRKRASDASERTSTVAKRQITKADIPPDDTSESENDEDETNNKSVASKDTDSSAEASSESALAEPTVIPEENMPTAKDNEDPDEDEEDGEEDEGDEDDTPEMSKAELLERVRSPARSRSVSVPALTGSPSKLQSHTANKNAGDANESHTVEATEKSEEQIEKPEEPTKEAIGKELSGSESVSSSESESQSESEDESDKELFPPSKNSAPPPSTAPAALNGVGVLPNGHSPALRPSARSSLGSFTSSQPDSAGKLARPNLKGMLAEQKSLQAERAKKSKMHVFSNQNHRPARKDVFSPSGSSESESESDSGDEW